jgi:transcriptional regulator with XRE-family HTH domain
MPKPPRLLDPDNPVHAFARELRGLRLRAEDPPTQKLAREMACSHSTLSAYLNGHRLPPYRQLVAFARLCGVSDAGIKDLVDRLELAREQAAAWSARPEMPSAGTVEPTPSATSERDGDAERQAGEADEHSRSTEQDHLAGLVDISKLDLEGLADFEDSTSRALKRITTESDGDAPLGFSAVI